MSYITTRQAEIEAAEILKKAFEEARTALGKAYEDPDAIDETMSEILEALTEA